jgi:hypothetical protein
VGCRCRAVDVVAGQHAEGLGTLPQRDRNALGPVELQVQRGGGPRAIGGGGNHALTAGNAVEQVDEGHERERVCVLTLFFFVFFL